VEGGAQGRGTNSIFLPSIKFHEKKATHEEKELYGGGWLKSTTVESGAEK